MSYIIYEDGEDSWQAVHDREDTLPPVEDSDFSERQIPSDSPRVPSTPDFVSSTPLSNGELPSSPISAPETPHPNTMPALAESSGDIRQQFEAWGNRVGQEIGRRDELLADLREVNTQVEQEKAQVEQELIRERKWNVLSEHIFTAKIDQLQDEVLRLRDSKQQQGQTQARGRQDGTKSTFEKPPETGEAPMKSVPAAAKRPREEDAVDAPVPKAQKTMNTKVKKIAKAAPEKVAQTTHSATEKRTITIELYEFDPAATVEAAQCWHLRDSTDMPTGTNGPQIFHILENMREGNNLASGSTRVNYQVQDMKVKDSLHFKNSRRPKWARWLQHVNEAKDEDGYGVQAIFRGYVCEVRDEARAQASLNIE